MAEQCFRLWFAMVVVGFLVEGTTEKVIVESDDFQSWLNQQGLQLAQPVIDAQGGGNLLKAEKLASYLEICRQSEPPPEHIFVLTDLEQEPCFSAVKTRIGAPANVTICIARKTIEAWFLADSLALANWQREPVDVPEPEAMHDLPWDYLKSFKNRGGGPGSSKVLFAKKMVSKYAFSIQRAAEHPACPSAAYFLKKLRELASAQTLSNNPKEDQP